MSTASSQITYKPPQSVQDFLQCEQFVSLIMGPVGSGKTTAAIFKILYHASRMRKQADGVRRSRCIIIRNTRQMLADSTIPSIQQWFGPDILSYAKVDGKMMLKVGDVQCEILLRGLDDQDDVRRLLSVEASFAMMDEFREINQAIFDAVQGRVGRYPSKGMGGCYTDDGSPNYHVWGATNPPDADTPWAKYLEDPPDNAGVFMQPSGLSGEADWVDNLVEDYYDNLAQGKSEDWVDVYVHGKFGRSLSGQPVFGSFRSETHVAANPLNYIKSSTSPLVVGMDFGLNPSVTIGQLDPFGRALVYADLTSDGMGTLRFVRERLKPLLASKFPGMPVIIIGDPAGVQRAQTDERSVFDILRQEGFRAIAAKTNSVVARISAVDSLLTRMVDGRAAIQIDPSCSHIIRALRGGYRYKLKKNGEIEDSPEKNASSHIADSLQYFALHINQLNFGDTWQSKARKVEKIRYAWA
jgi:hypothetical protein